MKHPLAKTLSLSTATVTFLAAASPVLAQPREWEEGFCVQDGAATIQGLQCLLGNIFSVMIGLIGLVAFVVIIIAAMKYMLSGTNTKTVDSSKQAITYAIAGIIVALSAFIILNVLSSFTGIDLTKFVIPSSN